MFGMSTLAVTGKVFYVNGMTTSVEDANSLAKEIAQVSHAPVEAFHNDTTSSDVTAEIAGKSIFGILGLVFAYKVEKKSVEETALAAGVAVTSAGLLNSAYGDFMDIQERKAEKADQLVDRVSQHLMANPYSTVTLVFHSQGAHIGRTALPRLQHLAGRINVVTLGGAVNIPQGFAARVSNFTDVRDLVSATGKVVFNSSVGSTGIVSPSCSGPVCHSAEHYLSSSLVRRTIEFFSRPTHLHFN